MKDDGPSTGFVRFNPGAPALRQVSPASLCRAARSVLPPVTCACDSGRVSATDEPERWENAKPDQPEEGDVEHRTCRAFVVPLAASLGCEAAAVRTPPNGFHANRIPRSFAQGLPISFLGRGPCAGGIPGRGRLVRAAPGTAPLDSPRQCTWSAPAPRAARDAPYVSSDGTKSRSRSS